MNAHQEAAYKGASCALPNSEAARDEVILLPLFDSMTEEEQDRVIGAMAMHSAEEMIPALSAL